MRELVARLLDSAALGQRPERLEHLSADRDLLLASVQAAAALDGQDRVVALPAYAELGLLACERQVALEDAGAGTRVVGDRRDEELALDLVTGRHARAVPQPAIGSGCFAARFCQRRSTERAKRLGRRRVDPGAQLERLALERAATAIDHRQESRSRRLLIGGESGLATCSRSTARSWSSPSRSDSRWARLARPACAWEPPGEGSAGRARGPSRAFATRADARRSARLPPRACCAARAGTGAGGLGGARRTLRSRTSTTRF